MSTVVPDIGKVLSNLDRTVFAKVAKWSANSDIACEISSAVEPQLPSTSSGLGAFCRLDVKDVAIKPLGINVIDDESSSGSASVGEIIGPGVFYEHPPKINRMRSPSTVPSNSSNTFSYSSSNSGDSSFASPPKKISKKSSGSEWYKKNSLRKEVLLKNTSLSNFSARKHQERNDG